MSADQLRYQVADLSLADFGRKEIQLAEHEMPGLMAVRAEPEGPQLTRRPGLGGLKVADRGEQAEILAVAEHAG